MEEIWKDLSNYPGYQASNLGNIRSIDRILYKLNRWGSTTAHKLHGRVLKFDGSKNNSGYYTCALGYKKKVMPHRLIAETFVPKNRDDLIVNHKNGNKTDNRSENLEWVSYKENSIHSRRVLGKPGKSLSLSIAKEIIVRAGSGVRVSDLAAHYSVSRQCVSRILSGRMWNSKDYPELSILRSNHPYTSPKFGRRWFIG